MTNLAKISFRASGWSLLSVTLIVLAFLIVIFHHEIFPLSLDIYYHLLTALGFREAGGVSFIDFWNYAPSGRPNLYPPFFSLVLSFFINTGVNSIVIARIICILIYFLFLSTLWAVIRDRFGERVAFFTLLSSMLPYAFFLSLLNQLPAAISLILFLLIFYFIENKRIMTATLILGFLFYVHLTMPWITMATLLFYGLFNKKRLKDILSVASFGLLLGLPWVINLVINRRYFDLSRVAESPLFEFYPLFILLGIAGIFLAWRERRTKNHTFLFASLAAISVLVIRYPYRVFGGEGLLILAIFSGIALDNLYQRIARRFDYGILTPFLIAAALIIFSPSIFVWTGPIPWDGYKKVQFELRGSTLPRMVTYYQRHMESSSLIGPMETALVFDRILLDETEAVKENTKDDELIYSNIPYLAGLLGCLSGRFITTGMLYEITPYEKRDPVSDARLVVWLKEFDGKSSKARRLEAKYKLRKIYEDGLVYIYKNDTPSAKAIKPIADLSYGQAAFLFLLFVLGIAFDLSRRKNESS